MLQKNKSVSTGVKSGNSFLEQVKSEFFKITWTKQEELLTYTKIVIGATFLCGFSVYFIDLTIKSLLQMFEHLFKVLFS